jgi:glutathione S-transferase
MKLYYSPGVCSLSPHIVAREAGLKIDLVKTDIRAKKTADGADYWTVNPNGYVPALQLDDGSLLTEGPAIVQYLADRAPEAKLAPANGTIERYRMQQWLNYISSELHKGAFSPLFNPAMPEEAKAIFRERLGQRLDVLDKHLAAKQFLMGNSFTCPDAYCFTVLNWTRPLKFDLSKWTNVTAYQARVAARPAVQEAMRADGLIK